MIMEVNYMEFSSLKELYNNLLPVLKTKVNEMKLRGIDYVREIDIWNYNQIKWTKSINLTYFDMVSDILNTNDNIYTNYIKNKWKENRESLSNDDIL